MRSPAAGGLVAGICFELAKALYTFAVARFFRYHAVYGSVAAIPIFLLWLQVSWTLVLFGGFTSRVVAMVWGAPPGTVMVMVQELYDFGVAVDVEAPPADDVVDFTDILRQGYGLGG